MVFFKSGVDADLRILNRITLRTGGTGNFYNVAVCHKRRIGNREIVALPFCIRRNFAFSAVFKMNTVHIDYCAIIGLNQKDLENQGILA